MAGEALALTSTHLRLDECRDIVVFFHFVADLKGTGVPPGFRVLLVKNKWVFYKKYIIL